MMTLISFKTISQHPDLFYSLFELHHREFMIRQDYQAKTVDGLEFDQYDNFCATYIVYSENGKSVLGASRLTPISFGCMLADHFPQLVADPSVFDDRTVWESTRFVVDSTLPAPVRLKVYQHIICANIEFGLANQITQIIGLMPTLILRSVFERAGVKLDRLGPVQQVGEHARIQAASIAVCPSQLDRVFETMGIRSALPGLPRQLSRSA